MVITQLRNFVPHPTARFDKTVDCPEKLTQGKDNIWNPYPVKLSQGNLNLQGRPPSCVSQPQKSLSAASYVKSDTNKRGMGGGGGLTQ